MSKSPAILMDVYVTNIETLIRHNLLLRNDSTRGSVAFTRMTHSGTEGGGWGWGATFFDVDNDGDLDIAATNGRITLPEVEDSSKLFENTGGEPMLFADSSDATGFNDSLLGSSVVAADFDRDGDLDLAQTCRGLEDQEPALRLLENQQSGTILDNGYLVVRPRMPGANHFALGAVVRLEAGDLNLVRLISAGTSYLGQEPAEAFYGTGTAESIARVTVEWPGGGGRSALIDVATHQIVEISSSVVFANGFESGDLSAW